MGNVKLRRLLALVSLTTLCGQGLADPCGMVPPIVGNGPSPIQRVGMQETYVFFKNGIECVVIRPGFSGKADDFGMLVPFPTIPSIRKVPDNIFPQLAAAFSPPEIVFDYSMRNNMGFGGLGGGAGGGGGGGLTWNLQKNEVKVLKEEAVGRYQAVTLAAGSAEALNKWMDEHGYKYPKGMDAVCDDYIRMGWCFVAERARVNQRAGIEPKPGMKDVDPKLPDGSTFDGYVQGMEFRFRTDKPIIPMRLSAHNEGDLHNRLFILTDGPVCCSEIPNTMVRRQLPGTELVKHLTKPLSVRVIGGPPNPQQIDLSGLPAQRDPYQVNGQAKELIAADVQAVNKQRLEHPHEEEEKALVRLSERLDLRGPEIDNLIHDELKREHEANVTDSSSTIATMTLTVIDGVMDRPTLQKHDLTLKPFRMDPKLNSDEFYDAVLSQPAGKKKGILISQRQPWPSKRATPNASLVAQRVLTAAPIWSVNLLARNSETQEQSRVIDQLAAELALADKVDAAEQALIKLGSSAVPKLQFIAVAGKSIKERGSAIHCLAKIGGKANQDFILSLATDERDHQLVRYWAWTTILREFPNAMTFDLMIAHGSKFPLTLPKCFAVVMKGRQLSDAESAKLLLLAQTNAGNPTLLKQIVAAVPPEQFLQIMLSGNIGQRQFAAGLIASCSPAQTRQLGIAYAKAVKFDPDAKQPPWRNGPFYLPSAPWSRESFDPVLDTVTRWALWAERKGDTNLRAMLTRTLIAQLNSFPDRERTQGTSVDDLLKEVAVRFGKPALRALLEEQGVFSQPRYKGVYEGIP